MDMLITVLLLLLAMTCVAGVAMFVVGLVQHRPRLWGTGLGMSGLVVVVIFGALLWYGVDWALYLFRHGP